MKSISSVLPLGHFVIGDTHLVSSNVPENEYSAWAAGATYALGDRVQIVSPTSTVTFTIASPAVCTWTAHGLPDGTPLYFTTTSTLPMGIVAGRYYFTRDATANTFKLSADPDGTAIVTSGSQSGTHTAFATRHDVYESLVGSNLGNPPAISPNHWVRVDSTNRWRAHDDSMGSQTVNADTIENVYSSAGITDGVALLNIDAAEVHVTQTDAVAGVVYDETVSGVMHSGITDFYPWFFAPPVRVSDVVLTGLKPYLNSTVAVTLTDIGGMPKLGECVIGKLFEAGSTRFGLRTGIQSYSIKEANPFGIVKVKKRGFSRTEDMQVYVDNINLDRLVRFLESVRDTPIVYIGADPYSSAIAFGFYNSWETVIDYPTQSLLTISIASLV